MLGATVSGPPSDVGITEGDHGSLWRCRSALESTEGTEALDDSSPR